MNNTFQFLLTWDKGQAFAERMSAKLLGLEGYSDLDPQLPMGGPDGRKDLLCTRDGRRIVAGCYFPSGQKRFSDISEKIDCDFEGVVANKADGFVFVTNQKITPGERLTLSQKYSGIEIFHGERVCGILDSPKGYGVRLEYLGIELSKAEQVSFLNAHLDLKEQFADIRRTLDSLKMVTVQLAGSIAKRDHQSGPVTFGIPIAGVLLSSRLTVEDLFGLHRACAEGQLMGDAVGAFRKIEVWIGAPGSTKETARFVPAPPNDVRRLTVALLEWWRTQYSHVVYGSDQDKIGAVAEFHSRFLQIHPFLDANGRVARLLASIQYRDLLGSDLSLARLDDRARYYEALEAARDGSPQKLIDVFLSLAK